MVALTEAKRRLSSAGDDVRDRVAPAAGSARDTLGSAVAETKGRVGPAIDDAKSKIAPAIDDAKSKIGPAIDDAKSKIGPAIDDAKSKIGPAIDDAKGRVGPALDDAKGRVVPALGDARDKIAPALDDARGRLVPVAQQAIAGGKRHGRRAAVTLRLAEEPKKRRPLRTVLILLALSAVGYLVYRKISGGGHDDWSEPEVGSSDRSASFAPKPDHVAAAQTAPLASEETKGSDEPTTPDAPLEETKVEQD